MPIDLTDQNPDMQQALAGAQGGPPSMMNMGAIPPTNPVQASVQPQAGPMPTQMGGGPIGIGGGVATMTPSQQPSGPLDLTQMGAQAMQTGTRLTQEQIQLANRRAQQAIDEALTPYTAKPKYGYGDIDWQSPKTAGGFIKDLGKALLLATTMTRPGQAVESAIYGPGIARYQKEKSERAERIGALEKGAQEAAEPVAATGRMGPAYMGAATQAARASTYAQDTASKLQNRLATQNINWGKLQTQQDMNRAKIALDAALTEAVPKRLELERYGIDANNETRMAVANVMSQLGIDRASPVAGMIDDWLVRNGYDPMIQQRAPQTPGGAQPVVGQKSIPPTRSAAPTRPSGVPSNYQYNPKTRHWSADGKG